MFDIVASGTQGGVLDGEKITVVEHCRSNRLFKVAFPLHEWKICKW